MHRLYHEITQTMIWRFYLCFLIHVLNINWTLEDKKCIILINRNNSQDTNLGLSTSGTWRKLELRGFCGLNKVGTGLASNSATGTCGLPKPAWIPYNISWNTLKKSNKLAIFTSYQCQFVQSSTFCCWYF